MIKAGRGRNDETRAEYAQLRAQLRAVRDANRREDVWVERIFMLVPAAENPNIVESGVDTEKRFELPLNLLPQTVGHRRGLGFPRNLRRYISPALLLVFSPNIEPMSRTIRRLLRGKGRVDLYPSLSAIQSAISVSL